MYNTITLFPGGVAPSDRWMITYATPLSTITTPTRFSVLEHGAVVAAVVQMENPKARVVLDWGGQV